MLETRDPFDQDDSAEREAADWFVQRQRGLSGAEHEAFAAWLASSPRHGELLGEIEETWRQLGRAPAEARHPELPARKAKVLRFILPFAAAAVAVGAVIFAARRSNSNRNYAASVATAVGELRNLELPDHSVVQLSADTTVQVDLTSEARRIDLQRGEAVFLVSKHPDWPFIVRAGTVQIRAVGTAFDVRLGGEAIDLFVTEGKVQVTDTAGGSTLLKPRTDSTPLLLAGQHVRILRNGNVGGSELAPEIFTPERMNDALAWRSRRLVFHGDRLGDIVDQFNRFNRHRLVLGSSALSERRFGGTFPANDYDSLVKTLEHDYGVAGERLPQETRLTWTPVSRTLGPPAETRLVFKSERLRDIVAEFNRHSTRQLVIDSPELAEMRFGGTFPANDSETFVAMLEQNFSVIAVRSAGEIRLRSANDNSADRKFP